MAELDPDIVKQLGLPPGGPKARELTDSEVKAMGLPADGNTFLNKARVVGTGAIEGLAQVGDAAKSIMGSPASALPPSLMPKGVVGDIIKQGGYGGTGFAQKLGLPTKASEEAARLGVKMDPVTDAATAFTRNAAPALLLRSGAGAATLAGAGAAVGRAVGGDTGETVGSIAGPLGLLALSRGVGNRAAANAARPPATEELRLQAQNAYQAADNAGVIIAQPALQRLEAGIAADMARQGMDDMLHPRVARVMQRITEDAARGNMTLEGSEILRRVMKNAASSADASERRLAQRMVNRLDEFVTNLRPTDLVQGNRAGIAELQNARTLWSRSAKADTIETLMERAATRAQQFSGSGMENALRTEFRQLALNQRRMRLFTADEQAAIRRVAEGGTLGNIMRFVGRGAPRGAIMQATHAGSILTNPAVGIPLAAVTEGARRGATALTQRNARLAAEIMRRGGPAPRAARPLTATERFLLRAAAFGGAAAGLQN